MAEVETAAMDLDRSSPHTSDIPKSPEDVKAMLDSSSAEPPKKRRRVAKPNAEKKFECKHEGCGKSYLRSDRLQRHKLNRKYLSLTAGVLSAG